MNKSYDHKEIVLQIPKPKLDSAQLPESEDQQLQRYLIPLDGKLILAQDINAGPSGRRFELQSLLIVTVRGDG